LALTLDKADFHTDEAKNERHAAVHIALLYAWLVLNGHSTAPEEAKDAFERRTETPTELFATYCGWKLMLTDVSEDARSFVDEYYETYFRKVDAQSFPNLVFNHKHEPPYNLRDSWDNVEAVSAVLGADYAQFRADA
jgi:hypothetical protein